MTKSKSKGRGSRRVNGTNCGLPALRAAEGAERKRTPRTFELHGQVSSIHRFYSELEGERSFKMGLDIGGDLTTLPVPRLDAKTICKLGARVKIIVLFYD